MELSFIASLTFSWRFISTVFYFPLPGTIQSHSTSWNCRMKLQSFAAGAEGKSISSACQCRAISSTPGEQLGVKVPLICTTVSQTPLCITHIGDYGEQGMSMQANAALGTQPQNSQVKPTVIRNPYSLENPNMWQ